MKKFLLKILFLLLLFSQYLGAEVAQGWQKIGNKKSQLILDRDWQIESGDNAQKASPIPVLIDGNGKTILSHKFFIDDSMKNRKLVLQAPIVQPACTVKLNGKFIGNNYPAVNFVELVLKPEYLNFDTENILTFEINPQLNNRSTLPLRHRPLGLKMTKGLLAPVIITALPQYELKLKKLHYAFTKAWRSVMINLDLALENPEAISAANPAVRNGEVRVHLRKNGKDISREKKRTFALNDATSALTNIEIKVSNILAWSPATPDLYQLRVDFLLDGQLSETIQQSIGFRDIKIAGRQFLLNGNEFQINGIDWFDNLAGLQVEERVSAIDRLMEHVKKLGANVLRSVASPVPVDVLQACAENGILVLQEIPVKFANATQLANKKIRSDAEVGLQKLIERDKFNSAVMGWGIGTNLMDYSPEALAYTSSLVRLAHNLDARPLYLMTRSQERNACLEKVDFLLLDNFEKENIAFDPTLLPDKPLLPVLGYFVKPFLVSKDYTQTERRWLEAEEIQADQLEKILRFLKEHWPDYAGSIVHSLQDWQGEFATMIISGYPEPDKTYHAGLLRADGDSRIAYKMIAALNKGERRPNISPNSTALENPIIFTLAGVLIVLFVLFYLRRDRRLNSTMRRIFIHPHGFYTDLYENRKVPAFITSIVAGAQSLVLALLFASSFYACREFLLFDEVLNLILPFPAMKSWLVTLVWNPGWLVCLLAILFIFLTILFALLLRILGFILGKPASIGQYTTFLFWAATCYLPLALITPVFYRILLADEALFIPLGIILFFVVWHLLRVYRGMRVLMALPPGKAFVLFISILVILTGTVAFYYNHTQALFGYIDYYWRYLN